MRRRRGVNPFMAGILLTICILAVFVVFAFLGMDKLWNRTGADRITASEDAIRRAAVQCYALEGSYPPQLAYLEDHYGIQLNTDKYDYYYNTFGSNIVPQIKVYEKKAVPAQ